VPASCVEAQIAVLDGDLAANSILLVSGRNSCRRTRSNARSSRSVLCVRNV